MLQPRVAGLSPLLDLLAIPGRLTASHRRRYGAAPGPDPPCSRANPSRWAAAVASARFAPPRAGPQRGAPGPAPPVLSRQSEPMGRCRRLGAIRDAELREDVRHVHAR